MLKLALLFVLIYTQRGSGQTCQCQCPKDIVYVVDESGSIGATNFQKVREALSDSVEDFDIGPNDSQTHVGLDTFNDVGHYQWGLDTFTVKSSLQMAIEALPYDGGSTNIVDGMEVALNLIFGLAGDRPNVLDVMVVITDGVNNPPNDQGLVDAAADAAARGITVWAVGVGNETNTTQLAIISGTASRVISIDNFDALGDALKSIPCPSPPTPSPPPTTEASTCPVPTTPVPPPAVCKNLNPYCAEEPTVCNSNDPITKAWAETNCRLTCGFCTSNHTCPANGKCPPSWVYNAETDRCYWATPDQRRFDQIYLECVQVGGIPASIHSIGENNFLTGYFPQTTVAATYYWIGFHPKLGATGANRWVDPYWDDASPADYTNWDPLPTQQPSNALLAAETWVAMDFKVASESATNGKWSDWDSGLLSLASVHPGFCSRPACDAPIPCVNLNAYCPTLVASCPAGAITTYQDAWMAYNCRATCNRCTVDSVCPASDPCPKDWKHYDGSCYWATPTQSNYSTIRNTCQGVGAEVVSVHSLLENTFLTNYFPTDPSDWANQQDAYYWIGLHPNLTSGGWSNPSWDDGTPNNYLNWRPTQPSNAAGENFTAIRLSGVANNGLWDDFAPYVLPGFCKRPACVATTTTTTTTPPTTTTTTPSTTTPVIVECKNQDTICPWLAAQCATNATVYAQCPYTCGACTPVLDCSIRDSTGNCPKDMIYNPYSDKCIWASKNLVTNVNYMNAQCAQSNGTLLSIHNLTENDFIRDQFPSQTSTGYQLYFIGLHRTNDFGWPNAWWYDGTPSDYRHWDAGQPDQGVNEAASTMVLNGGTTGWVRGYWHDVYYTDAFPGLCHRPSCIAPTTPAPTTTPPPTTTTPTTPSTTTTPVIVCKNQDTICPWLAAQCATNPAVVAQCPYTCGACTPVLDCSIRDSTGNCPKDTVYNPYSGKCFWASKNVVTNTNNMNAQCAQSNGTLISIHNLTENNLIRDTFPSQVSANYQLYFIGLWRTNSFGWPNALWYDGTPSDYRHWDVGQPQQNTDEASSVMVLNGGNTAWVRGYWHDVSYLDTFPGICHKPNCNAHLLPCKNSDSICPWLAAQCTTNATVYSMCPATCGACTPLLDCSIRDSTNKCPKDTIYNPYSNKCIWASSNLVANSNTMNAQCAQSNGTLISIHNLTENDFIRDQIPSQPQTSAGWQLYFIGLYRTNNFGWPNGLWYDGTPSDYRHWDVGQPNQGNNEAASTMVINGHTTGWVRGYWHDVIYTDTYPGICHKPTCDAHLLPCTNQDAICPWLAAQCTTNATVYTMCPATCGACTPRLDCSVRDSTNKCPMDTIYNPYSNKCIWASRNVVTNTNTMNAQCAQSNGTLISIHNITENDFIRDQFPSQTSTGYQLYFIGLWRTNSFGWPNALWYDGTPSDYRHWDVGQPQQNVDEASSVMVINGGTTGWVRGYWHDVSYLDTFPGICHRPICA